MAAISAQGDGARGASVAPSVAAGVPEAFVAAMLGFHSAYRAGWSGPSEDLERLAGRPVIPSLQAVAAGLDGTAK